MAELEAREGHLLVVGGRAVSMPPPGALVETAPRRAARGREGDRLFILVTPAGELRVPGAFFEEMARLAADAYFSSGGGVTGGLREALTTLNRHLLTTAEPGAEPQWLDVLALVLHGDELFAARSGGTFAAIYQNANLAFFPLDRRDPLAHSAPLGAENLPDIQLARYTVGPGCTLLLADAGLSQASDDDLQRVLSEGSLPPILNALKGLADRQTSASVIVLAAPDGQVHPVPPLPEPVHVPQPVAPTPASELSVPLAGSDAHAAPWMEQARPVAAVPTAELDRPEPDESPAPVLERARDALDRVTDVVSDAASRVAETSRERGPSAFTRAVIGVRRGIWQVVHAVLAALLGVLRGLESALGKVLPEPGADGKQGIPTNVAVGLALLIPIVIVVVVVGLALSNRGQTDFEIYLATAKDAHQDALTRSAGACVDPELRAVWEDVMGLAEQAGKFRPDDIEVLQIQADAQNYLDCFDVIERRAVKLLHQFPEGADLVGPVVQGGIDLFVLDRTSGTVYHDTLNERGDGLTARDDRGIVGRGSAVGQYVVGDIFDIEWLPNGNVLLAPDRNGVLVTYSSTFFASAHQLVVDARWVDPIAIAVFRSNLYVLDRGADQIWRYVQPAGERRYTSAPEEYFTGSNLPDLSTAVDFGISETGEIFILYADGSVERYLSGEPQTFTYNKRPEGTLTSGHALFIDNDPASRSLYIVDGENETIYETSWAGTFGYGYRPLNPTDAFEGISGVFADTVVRNNMYVVAGNQLLHFARSE
ncbi:MAG: hypothetical protein GXY36_16330 [Chloroflexi bacterium]|nr:hypothetical protein [Chloroflexota bacterium]